MLTRLAVTLFAINLSLFARSTPSEPSAVAPTPETDAPESAAPVLDEETLRAAIKLHLARNGRDVIISWEIPEVPIKGVDIYRHTENRTKGRLRLKFARPRPSTFTDITPDAEVTYWYWIKVVFKDGRFINYGPLETPPPDVWEP